MTPPPSSANLQGFQIPSPQTPDPLQTLAQMGQLRNQALQRQEAQIQIQQNQMALKSNQAMMQAFAQGNGDWPTTQKLLDSSPDILPTDRIALEQHRVQVERDWASLTEEKQKIQQWNADKYRANLTKAADDIDAGANPKDAMDQANLKSVREGVSFVDPNAPAGSSTGVPQMITYPGDTMHLRGYGSSLILPPQIAEEALKKAQAAGETAKAAPATRALAISEVQAAIDPNTGVPNPADYASIQKRYPGVSLPASPTQANIAQLVKSAVPVAEQPKTQIEQMKADLMSKAQAGLQNGIHPIDSILPASVDPQANASYKASYNIAMQSGGPDAANSVAQAAAAHAAAIAMKSNPSVIAGEAKTAAAQAAATAPIKTGEAVATAVGTERGKAGLLPAPWNQLSDPGTAKEAMGKSDALDTQYRKSMSAAQELIDVIRANQHGNQLAGAQIQMEQLRAIVNRVTDTELGASQEFKTKLREINDYLAKNTKGQWSADTLKEFVDLANIRKTGAENEYNAGQESIGKNYGVRPPHLQLPKGIAPAPGGGSGSTGYQVGQTVMYQGKPHRITAIDSKTGKLTIDPRAAQ